jgi:glycosyltransferase involved in cell wall biosynthesis
MVYFLINSLKRGGAENVLLKLSNYIKSEKIFLLEKGEGFNSNKNLFFLSNSSSQVDSFLKYFYVPIYSFRLSKHLKENDIVVSFLERANFVNVVSKIFKKHKAIISVRIDPLEYYRGRKKIILLFLKKIYPGADLIISVSKKVKQSLVNLGIDEAKIKVIYNPISIKESQEKSKESLNEYAPIFKNPVLINVGRLSRQKGQWFLIRIFKEIKKEVENLKLVILGDGEFKDYLVELSKDLNLRTYVWDKNKVSEDFDVYFLGSQSNPFKFLSASRLFVFTSLAEGFPNVILEAMSCKLPIVSSDCYSGPREILAPDTDFNFSTKTVEFAKYGILMPTFEDKLKKAKDILTKEELVWSGLLKEILFNEKLLSHYRTLSQKRAQEFKIENIIKEWENLLCAG